MLELIASEHKVVSYKTQCYSPRSKVAPDSATSYHRGRRTVLARSTDTVGLRLFRIDWSGKVSKYFANFWANFFGVEERMRRRTYPALTFIRYLIHTFVALGAVFWLFASAATMRFLRDAAAAAGEPVDMLLPSIIWAFATSVVVLFLACFAAFGELLLIAIRIEQNTSAAGSKK